MAVARLTVVESGHGEAIGCLLLLTAAASLAGTFLGFLVSAAAIILAFGTMPELRLLRESGKYEQVYVVFFNTMGWPGAVAYIGFSATIVPYDTTWAVALTLMLAWPVLVAVTRVWRYVWILRFICGFAVQRQVEADRVTSIRRASQTTPCGAVPRLTAPRISNKTFRHDRFPERMTILRPISGSFSASSRLLYAGNKIDL